MTDAFTIELPWPPSDNRLTRHAEIPAAKGLPWCDRCKRAIKTRVVAFPSEEAKEYQAKVQAILLAQKIGTLSGRLHVAVDLHPPTKRTIDPANRLKALMDSLKRRESGVRRKGQAPKWDPKQTVWLFADDDSQAVEGSWRLCPIVSGGKAVVTITKLPGQGGLFAGDESPDDDCPEPQD